MEKDSRTRRIQITVRKRFWWTTVDAEFTATASEIDTLRQDVNRFAALVRQALRSPANMPDLRVTTLSEGPEGNTRT